MKCNHCNKTIPEVSINCPYCREIVDPNAKKKRGSSFWDN